MKINNITRLTVALLGSSVLLSGCIKETLPQGGKATADQVADSPFAVEGLIKSMPTILVTNYLSLGEHIDFGYPSVFGATDRLAGEVFPCSGGLPGGNVYYDRWQFCTYPNDGGLAATGGLIPLFYYNYYQFIFTANDVIKTASATSPTAVGVAKTFRALYYLDLARMFDALPAKSPARPSYETERQAVDELTVPISREGMDITQLENNPRVTREVMFEFILGDLNDAEAALETYTPMTKNLPSLAVVYGLKARAYLWLGSFDKTYTNVPTGNAAYKLAAEYARKAITASGCTIMTENQWLDPKTGFNSINSAWMWAMIQSTDTVLNNLLSWSAHMSPEAIYGYGYGAQPGISVFSYNRMSATDFRKKSFVGPDRSYKAMKPYTTLSEEEFATIAPYASFKFHTANGEKSSSTIGNVTSIPLMRVEEMYLTEAEATAHYDAGTGKSLLEAFMSNRAVGYKVPAANELIEEIIFQKRIEFWGEGISFYDMKRMNIGMKNGDAGTNAPKEATYTTDGRAPFWNFVIPLGAVQQNVGLKDKNNPNPTKAVDFVD